MFELAGLVETAEEEVSDLLDEFAPDADRETLLGWYEVLARDLLTMAAGELLVGGKPQGFFGGLARCAENGRRVLRLMQLRGLELPPASSNVPLLAAVTATDWGRAAAIVSASRPSRAKADGEYEEEFLWASVLGRLIAAPGVAPGDLAQVLAAISALDDEGFGGRVAVVQALLDRDAAAFAEAFSNERRGRERQTEETAARFGTPVRDFGPHRFLWLEGLALLRLAERLGLPWPDQQMRLCPPLALVAPKLRYAGEGVVNTGAWAV
jgi:hypothetical protein